MNCAEVSETYHSYGHVTKAEGYLIHLLEQILPAEPANNATKGDAAAVINRTIKFIQHLENEILNEA